LSKFVNIFNKVYSDLEKNIIKAAEHTSVEDQIHLLIKEEKEKLKKKDRS